MTREEALETAAQLWHSWHAPQPAGGAPGGRITDIANALLDADGKAEHKGRMAGLREAAQLVSERTFCHDARLARFEAAENSTRLNQKVWVDQELWDRADALEAEGRKNV